MIKKRKYFACSVCQPGEDYCEENLKRIINNKAFVLHAQTQQKGVYSDIEEGDILLLKYNNQFIAFAEALGRNVTTDPDWNLTAPVKEWYFKNDSNIKDGVSTYGIQEVTIGGGVFGTVKRLNQEFGLDKIKSIKKTSPLVQTVLGEVNAIKTEEKMEELIKVLKNKKQLILQGPPGTGKTRLAKLMAESLIKLEKKLKPAEYIERYIQKFIEDSKIKENKEANIELLQEFTEAFPKDQLDKLTLDKYCIGKGDRNTFCYWLERGLGPLGRFSPGLSGAPVYLVYYSNDDKDYKTDKIEGEPAEVMATIANVLHNLVNNLSIDEAKQYFRAGLILKVLHSYYPENYFPVFNHKHIRIIAKWFEVDTQGLDEISINLKINAKFQELKQKHKSAVSNFDLMGHLYTKFDLKNNSSKFEAIELVEDAGEYKIIQFHPAYSYEDFVRGISAHANAKSQIEYKVENRILAELAEKALNDSSANYILVIDEINRANLPAVLGELIYALEYRYDEEDKKNTSVESIYALKANDGSQESSKVLRLPNNLLIIGTMNTADRSVGHIDYAIRRRFAFKDVLPTIDPIMKLAMPLFEAVSDLFVKNFKDIKWDDPKLVRSDSLASDFRPEDVWIGHSYFITKEDGEEGLEELRSRLKYEIKPILKEYLKDGILQDTDLVRAKIEALNV